MHHEEGIWGVPENEVAVVIAAIDERQTPGGGVGAMNELFVLFCFVFWGGQRRIVISRRRDSSEMICHQGINKK